MSLNPISQNDEDDLALARQISFNGWRQGSVFDPRGVLNKITIAQTEISYSDKEFFII